MREREKAEQIGELAEKYSHTHGKLNHIEEKLRRFQGCLQMLNNPPLF
jgi:hypothetical protein